MWPGSQISGSLRVMGCGWAPLEASEKEKVSVHMNTSPGSPPSPRYSTLECLSRAAGLGALGFGEATKAV